MNKQHKEGLVLVYEYYDKSGLQYCLADGYDDFLQEPMAPDVKVEAFYPIFPLVFNEVEHKMCCATVDIKLLMPMQNSTTAPAKVCGSTAGPIVLSTARPVCWKKKIRQSWPPAARSSNCKPWRLARRSTMSPASAQIGIDPNLYEVKTIFDDVQLVVGHRKPTLAVCPTATETNIAESSRMSSRALTSMIWTASCLRLPCSWPMSA